MDRIEVKREIQTIPAIPDDGKAIRMEGRNLFYLTEINIIQIMFYDLLAI